MSTKSWINFITTRYQGSPWLPLVVRTIYYTAILAAVIYLHGKENFSMPNYIYQGF